MKRKAIVIGGGPNGLAAATTLGKLGLSVTVLEARAELGGLAAAIEVGEGYRVPGIVHDTRGLRDGVVDALGLGHHGLTRRREPLRICAPSRRGAPIWLAGARLEGAVTARDERAHRELLGFIERVGPVLRDLSDRPPPDPTGEVLPLLLTGLRVRRLGASDMMELLRVAPSCVADWMRDTYETERLRAAMALPAIFGELAGVWSAGTSANLLFAEASAGPAVEGGPAAVITALTKAAAAQGATLRTEARVSRIITERGVAKGVVVDGETIEASLIVSSIDPKVTFLQLIGEQRLPLDLGADIRNFRARGTTAKLHLALDGPLTLEDGTELEALRTGETLDEVERAFDPMKYGRAATEPVLDVWVPSMRDASLVPEEGHHVVSALVHGAPFAVAGGWDDAQKTRLYDAAVAALAAYCPGVTERIVASELLTPADIAAEYGISEGNLFHGERALDQVMFMRPTVDCARYATPIEGLFLGGSGSHPGGPLSLTQGVLAARAAAE